MDTLVSERSFRNSRSHELDVSFNGTILIPDISGFTKFVNETEFATGREITRQLLQVILNNNVLDLHVSEIEGDAILFYTKHALTPIQIKDQYELMLDKFLEKVKELGIENGFKIDLSLKLIAHYGELSTYLIGDFEKLYGKAIIEAHELLKNPIKSKSYFLLTDSIFNGNVKEFAGSSCYSGSQFCETYGELKKVGYLYFDYEDVKEVSEIRSTDGLLNEEEKFNFSETLNFI